MKEKHRKMKPVKNVVQISVWVKDINRVFKLLTDPFLYLNPTAIFMRLNLSIGN